MRAGVVVRSVARSAVLGVVWVLLSCASSAELRAEPAERALPRSVRYVYLVSADREVRPDFVRAITAAAETVQAFYGRQLGGPTFRLNKPVVEIARSDKPATWFYAHDSGSQRDNWGFDNGLAEAKRLLGAGHGQDYIWIIYSDGPGNSGRGGGGVAVMPEDDLLGLVGLHPTQKDPRRWVYGMAHELGHALGLSHPPDSAAVPNAVMGAGFYTCFPDACELTPDDLDILRASPFIRAPGAWAPPTTLAVYRYEGGSFTRVRDGDRVTWTEVASDDARYTFDETYAGDEGFVLDDRSRRLIIRIPREGGRSTLSIDGGESWRPLYPVTPDAPDAR